MSSVTSLKIVTEFFLSRYILTIVAFDNEEKAKQNKRNDTNLFDFNVNRYRMMNWIETCLLSIRLDTNEWIETKIICYDRNKKLLIVDLIDFILIDFHSIRMEWKNKTKKLYNNKSVLFNFFAVALTIDTHFLYSIEILI